MGFIILIFAAWRLMCMEITPYPKGINKLELLVVKRIATLINSWDADYDMEIAEKILKLIYILIVIFTVYNL